MNSEVHNDTAPDSGGGVSAFETMMTEYHIYLTKVKIQLPSLVLSSKGLQLEARADNTAALGGSFAASQADGDG